MIKILIPLFVLLFIPSALFGQLYQFNGEGADDRLGYSVDAAGDVNADGFDDLIVGAFSSNNNGIESGSAYVYSGADGSLLYQWDGQNTYDRFGECVSAAGDANGDGFDDVIVGALNTDNNGSSSGSAYLYSGVDGSLLYQWDGQDTADTFGESVSAAGDVNNDGFDDVIIGADGAESNGLSDNGSAYVYSGADGSLLHRWDGQDHTDRFGWCVSGAGDVNSDGFDDLIVGAFSASNNGAESGSAYVYSGADGSLFYQWSGQNAGDYFGGSVSGAGDVNGDGFDDLIVGAHWADPNGYNSGSVYVHSGADGSLIYQWDGQHAGDHFGLPASGAGDVNSDGVNDIIIGAHWADPNGTTSGSAYAYSGLDGSLLRQWDGSQADDRFGRCVAGAGDVNGDGTDDLIIGAYGADENGSFSGSAYVYYLSATYSITPMTAGSQATFTISGAEPNSNVILGYSLSGAGPFTTAFGIVDMTPPINTLAILSANANGDASWTVNVPGSASGRTLYTQGLNAGLLTNSVAELIN